MAWGDSHRGAVQLQHNSTMGTRAMAVWRVLVDLQASIIKGKRISFRISPTQSLDLQI